MKKIINVSKHAQTGFSAEDAKVIAKVIDDVLPKLKDKGSIELDFSGVKFYTTLFFNTSLTRLLENMSIKEYKRKIHLSNLSEIGKRTYQHSLDNAIEFYRLSKETRAERNKIISDIINEEQGE